jgi:translation initiation factor 1A
MLGNGRLEAYCFDGKNRMCHIRGKMRKKVWVNQVRVWLILQGDIILVGLRDYQDDKADVILKYNADEARLLKKQGELPESAKVNETDTQQDGNDDIPFVFDQAAPSDLPTDSSSESEDLPDIDDL